MRLGLEIEPAWLADHSLDPVGALVGAARHRILWQVGQAELDSGELGVNGSQLLFEVRDLLLERSDRGDLFGASSPCDLSRPIALLASLRCAFRSSSSAQQLPALYVELAPAGRDARLDTASGQQFPHSLGLLTQQFTRQHGARVYKIHLATSPLP